MICQQNHDLCRTRSLNAILPTRLVAVSEQGTGLSARLCYTHFLPAHAQYLTLSHRWASNDFLMMRRENKEAFEISIPVQDLTKTFQDALHATEKLGFEYIWIDALCIIQNDVGKADWKIEAPKMRDVYENAVCNLAAAGAANRNMGLYTKRDGQERALVRLRVQNEDFILQTDGYWQAMHNSYLFQRGWVFQEQLLVG
jgi:hypothetical protein